VWWDATFGSVPLEAVAIDDSFPHHVVANRQRWEAFAAPMNGASLPPRRARHLSAAAWRIRRAGRALSGEA
jgi:hypothetical protein